LQPSGARVRCDRGGGDRDASAMSCNIAPIGCNMRRDAARHSEVMRDLPKAKSPSGGKARPLDPDLRDPFLRPVAHELQGRKVIGLSVVAYVCAEISGSSHGAQGGATCSPLREEFRNSGAWLS
jgi:hypothetical protein